MLRAWRAGAPALASSDQSEERSALLLSDTCECDTIDEGEAFAYATETGNASDPEEWLAGEAGPRKRADTATYLESAKIELSRLRNNIRRHIALGCQLPVLDENDQSLRQEIAYYQSKKPLMPPDVKEFSEEDIAGYWIMLGVSPSAASDSPSFRTDWQPRRRRKS
jgi:hypothetical protein